MIYESSPMQKSAPLQKGIEATPAAPSADPVPAVPPPVDSAHLQRHSASLVIDVPADAKIYVNGYKTNTQGSHRSYRSAGLLPGQMYSYEVRAIVEREGKEITQQKTVSLRGGEAHKLSFDFDEFLVASN